MRAHLLEQNKIYGEQNIVNLVNHKGHEKPIKEAFEKYIDKVSYLLLFQNILTKHSFLIATTT